MRKLGLLLSACLTLTIPAFAEDAATTPEEAAIALQAKKAAADKATAEAATAAATTKKTEAEAQKAQVDVDAARNKAALDAIPANTTETGAITAKGTPGVLEGSLLVAKAINVAAAKIRGELGKNNTHRIILVAGTSASFEHLQLFDARVLQLTTLYKGAFQEAANAVASDTAKLVVPPPVKAPSKPRGSSGYSLNSMAPITSATDVAPVSAAGGDITGIGLAVASIAKILGYFNSNYEIGSVAATADDTMLVSAVAKTLPNAHLPDRLAASNSAADLLKRLTTLSAEYLLAKKTIDAGTQAIARNQAIVDEKDAKKAPEDVKAVAKATIQKWTLAKASLAAANTGLEALLTSLVGADDKTPPALAAIAREKAISDSFGADGYGLFLHVNNANGAYYLRQAIWTAFSALPFYTAGGAAISYTLIDRTSSRSVASGLLVCTSGYTKVTQAWKAIGDKNTITCSAD